MGLRRILRRVWRAALSIPVPLQRGWVAFARAVFGKGSWFLPGWRSSAAHPALAGQEFIVPGLLGVCVSRLRVSPLLHRSASAGLSGAKSMCGGFFPTSAVTAWPIFICISLVAKIPPACWNKECIYLHGLAWWAFPISHFKKEKKKFEV